MVDILNSQFPSLQQSNKISNSNNFNDNTNFYTTEINPFQKSNNYENPTLNNQFYINNNLNIYKGKSPNLMNRSLKIKNSKALQKTLNNNIGKSNFEGINVKSEAETNLPNYNRYSKDEDFMGQDFNNNYNYNRITLNSITQRNEFEPLSNTLNPFVSDLSSNENKFNTVKKSNNNYKALNRKSLENVNKININNLKRYAMNKDSSHQKSGSFLIQNKLNQKINRGNNNYNKMLALRRKIDISDNKKENITYNKNQNDFLTNNSQNFTNSGKKTNEKNSNKKNEHSFDNSMGKINHGNNLKYTLNNMNKTLVNKRNNFNNNFYYSAQKIKDNNLDKEIDDIVENIQFPLFNKDNEDDKKSESDELSSIADDIVEAFQTENKLSSSDTKDIQETVPSTSNNENDLLNSNNNYYTYNNNNNNKKNTMVIKSYMNNRKNPNMMNNNNNINKNNKVIYEPREKPTIVNNFFISQPNTQKNMNMPGSSKNINYSLFVLDNVNNNIINNNNNNNVTNNNEGLMKMKNKTYHSPFIFKNMQNQNKKFKNKNKEFDDNYGLSDNEATKNRLNLLSDNDFEELLYDEDNNQNNNLDYFLTKKIKNFRNTQCKTPNFEGRSYEEKMKTNNQILNPNNFKMDLINKRPCKKNNINEMANLKEILSSKKNRNSMTPSLNKPNVVNNFDKNKMEFTFNNNRNAGKKHICFNFNKNIIIAFDKDELITKSEITSNGKILPKKFKDMNTYQYELKIIQPKPIIKQYNKEDIKINTEYVLMENLPERQILPELYDDFEDDDIKSLEKSLEKSVDKIFDSNFK